MGRNLKQPKTSSGESCHRNNLVNQILKSLLLLTVLLCGAADGVWGGNLCNFSFTSLPSPTTETTGTIGSDEYTLLNTSNVKIFAKGLKTTTGTNDDSSWGFVYQQYGGNYHMKLQNADKGTANIKIQFTKGYIKAGDILKVSCGRAYKEKSSIMGYKVDNGSTGTEVKTSDSKSFSDGAIVLSHVLSASEIHEDGDNEYVLIYRYNSDFGYGSISVERGYKVTFASNDAALGSVTAKVNGNTIATGDYVEEGTEVTFTANTAGSNIWWKWYGTISDDYSSGKTKTITVNSDVTVNARLSKGIYLNAYTNNGTLGSVKMVRVESGTEATSFHLTPYPGDVKFVATPKANANFEGWYRDVDLTDLLTNELEYTQTGLVEQTEPINYWAKFTARSAGDGPIGGQRIKATLANIGTGALDTNTSTTDPETGEVTPVVIPGVWSDGLLKTQQTSYNHVDIFRFGALGNANVDDASNYTGFRFHANKIVDDNGEDKTRTPFRVLVYLSSEANPRIVTITDSNIEDFAYTWEDLGIASGKVANIERICFAGQQGGATLVKFTNVWIEKIDDPCHTFITYEDDIKKYNWDTKDYTYRLATPEGEATVVFSNITGGDRKDITNEIKLKENIVITAPAGKYLKVVKLITNTTADKLVFSPEERVDGNIVNPGFTKAVTDGNEVVWTRGGNTSKITISKAPEAGDVYIAKIEVVYNNKDVKHPALKKKSTGVYTVDLNLVKADTWSTVAYDEEITTAYCSKTTSYSGNFFIEFEDPLDLTGLTKLVVNYEGDKVGNVINFIDKDGTEKKAIYSYGNDGIINFTSGDVSALTNIKKILFNDGNGTTGAMKLNYIDFYISHIAPKVALDSNVSTEYTIGIGQPLTISAHATQGENGPQQVLWREYTYNDGVYTVIPGETNIIKEYNHSYTYTSSVTGVHYFGARAYQDCSAHEGSSWVTSEPVFVKVTVIENNINESRTVSTTTDEGDSENRDYWLYVPQNVKNGTNTNVPVVFALHGGSEDYQPTHNGQLNFNSLADQYNFVVVYPRAKERLFPHFNPNPARAWLATGGKNEDTEYFEKILDAIEHNTDGYTINTNRVYMAGFSVGGMMTYATANALPDKFAAFASIAGLPMNEVHLRHHGAKPVPFLHVHGTKDNFVNYKNMPTIVDNMVARNGLSYTPTSVTHGTADIWGDVNKTTYTKSVYGPAGSKTPYIYYEVGTGMYDGDTGMGHNHWCNLDGVDVKKVMWDFLSQFNLTDTRDNSIEFAPQINGMAPGLHNGWRVKENNNLLQYGESGGYSATTQNVYHSLQLNKGTHYLNFTVSGALTDNVNVRLYKIGSLDAFNVLDASFSTDPKEVVNKNYKGGQDITVKFETEEPGEYQLIIVKGNKYADIDVTDLSIKNTGNAKGTESDKPVDTDFGGYYNYNQRLFAQWNFDLCDGFRFNVKKLDIPATWTADYRNTDTGNENVKNGTVIYTYKPAITPVSKTDYAHYEELTYDGTNNIPAFAGLRFMAAANSIEVHVDYQNGIINGTHLVVDHNVKMLVPYVENSYRSDNDDALSPQPDKSNLDNYKNCMHHIKRDILYISLHEGSIWDGKHVITDECIDDPVGEKSALFHNGGDEFVNGHTYQKGDYFGRTGVPCVLQFSDKSKTVIDRIGVNRNLTFSFYTEYISEYGVPKPTPRMRVVGSPTGLKVAGIPETGATYEGAIAMTFGGWKNTDGNNKYEAYNIEQNKADHAVSDAHVTDVWSDLGVCIGNYPDKAKTFMTWSEAADYPVIGSVTTPTAADGFPVTSVSYQLAKSEALMPSSTIGNKYHEACSGDFVTSYTENHTPWTLPCRGAYVKFEPTLPGVLNVDVLQKYNKTYYLVDEFGKPVENVFTKTATYGSTNTPMGNGGYKVTGTGVKDDYVKYSFNVYPGKTYYIFSNEHGMGLTGFYYEPYVYRFNSTEDDGFPAGGTLEYARMDVEMKQVTLSDGVDYEYPTSLDENTSRVIESPAEVGTVNYTIHSDNRAVEVTLNRSFTANTWNSICLPFSLNQNMMEQVFGKGTRVILLRDIQDRKLENNNHIVANFIAHENQDILAGYPYFILPKKDVTAINAKVFIPKTAPHIPEISSVGYKTYDPSTTFDGLECYTFKGTFSTVKAPKGTYAMTSKGTLSRTTKEAGASVKPYRAYLEYNLSGESDQQFQAKAITMSYFGNMDEEQNTPTFIDNAVVDNDVVASVKRNDVYSIQGILVRRNAASLQGLPKGAYIMNGRKYVVE